MLCIENSGDDLNDCFANSGNDALGLGRDEAPHTFELSLYFQDPALTSIVFGEIVGSDPDGFFARFQGLIGVAGSDADKAFGQPEGFDTPPDTPPDTAVPEPSSLVLLGIGLLGARARLRTRRNN